MRINIYRIVLGR